MRLGSCRYIRIDSQDILLQMNADNMNIMIQFSENGRRRVGKDSYATLHVETYLALAVRRVKSEMCSGLLRMALDCG